MRLKNKIALITGAAEGIGKAIATRFVREGAQVAIADNQLEKAQETTQELGSTTKAFWVDVSQHNSVIELTNTVEDTVGEIDILVNNAGVSEIVPFLEMEEAFWENHMNVNLKGCYLCSQAVLKKMVPRKRGKIINLSSASGKQGNSQYEAYCTSKFGIIGLTQSMAMEFAPCQITVNAICPGFVKTTLWNKMLPRYAAKKNIPIDEVKDHILNKIPLGRFCQPEDVAGVAAFLASEDADYLTGQALNVTGGIIMH
jgi:NAD(P)-dependent dehydrogenase (short-subunit alcohol dehydrogenase family)